MTAPLNRSNYKTLLLSFLLMSAPAMAAPAEIASVIHASQPYGSGKYAVLFITAYDAEVWTDAAQWSMNAPFALTLRYHIGFSSDYLINRSLREMRHVNPALSDADIARYKKAMAFFAPASSGDEMTMLYQPGQPTRFFKNGAPTGEISEPGFAQDFFGVWLSPNTSDPDLRASLLKLKL
jgi:hypothetical protein